MLALIGFVYYLRPTVNGCFEILNHWIYFLYSAPLFLVRFNMIIIKCKKMNEIQVCRLCCMNQQQIGHDKFRILKEIDQISKNMITKIFGSKVSPLLKI